ncbi:MAG: hypothetical protein AAF664_17705, partial [Planctomycetota bacterium]
ITPENIDSIPDSVLGLDTIDLVVFNASGESTLEALSERHREVISRWITNGGTALISSGPRGLKMLQQNTWLARSIEADTSSLEEVTMRPAGLETFIASQKPLEDLPAVAFPTNRGTVLANARTDDRRAIPLAITYRHGLGHVIVTPFDLDSRMFSDWGDRDKLIQRLLEDVLTPSDQSDVSASQGYRDMAGQMRASLDRFGSKPSSPFSVLALGLLALVALVGPLDYLLINRLFGQPLLGWITLPVTAVGIAAITGWIVSQNAVANEDSETDLRAHRIEILDIDGFTGTGIGRSFDFFYSPSAQQADLTFVASKDMQGLSNSSKDDVRSVASPLGYPGPAYGGIRIAIDQNLAPYRPNGLFNLSEDDAPLVRSLPMAPLSTHAIEHRFALDTDVAKDTRLITRRGSEFLRGSFTNPLPFDVLDGAIIHAGWIYLLPTRLRAGGRVAAIEGLSQKNFRWRLIRKKAVENKSTSEDWTPEATANIQRLMELMLFYESAGGAKYTRLAFDEYPELDLTSTLTPPLGRSDRCILIGRLAEPMFEIRATPSSEAEEGEFQLVPQETTSMVRLVLPVDSPPARKSS